MNTLATLFLIRSSSFLQVTRTIIKARMGVNLGQIQQLTTELAAIEPLKSQYTGCFINCVPLSTILSFSK